jgi:NAD(P)-dependent dehydrogenase (short-subunit alcohol dehydrogenase family)
MKLANKTVVVVGASSGMGFATAAHLHQLGATVVMVGRNEERLRDAANEISEHGERLITIAADMTVAQDRQRILASVDELDHLIVTAADLAYMPIADFTEAAAMQVVQSKIIAPFFLAQAAMSKMKPGGSITFVSGIAAERPIAGGTMTGTVNGALNAMVRGLAIELAPIRVNAVSPGWIDTPLWKNIMSDERKAEAFSAMSAKIPARRIGTPQDVAEAIETSMTNGFMSGSVLYVDGGQRLV